MRLAGRKPFPTRQTLKDYCSGGRSVGNAFQNSQLASHALGDAHRDALLLAEREDHVPPPKELRSSERYFVPWNTKRGMEEPEGKNHGKIEGVASSNHANDAAVMPPVPHINRIEKRPHSSDL